MKAHPKLIHFALAAYLLIIFMASSIPGEELPKVGFEFSDKLVHAFVYLILYILFFYSLKYQSKSVKLRNNALIFAAVFSSLYGISDELHQMFVPMRSCEFSDWLADLSGVILGMLIVRFVLNSKAAAVMSLVVISQLISCNTSDMHEKQSADKLEASIKSEECWIDHMPVIDEQGPRLGFQIVVVSKNSGDSLTISKFYVSRSGGEFVERRFETRYEESEGKTSLVVIQSRVEDYFKDELKDNETVRFKLIVVNKKNGAKKTLTTSQIKPYKVY